MEVGDGTLEMERGGDRQQRFILSCMVQEELLVYVVRV